MLKISQCNILRTFGFLITLFNCMFILCIFLLKLYLHYGVFLRNSINYAYRREFVKTNFFPPRRLLGRTQFKNRLCRLELATVRNNHEISVFTKQKFPSHQLEVQLMTVRKEGNTLLYIIWGKNHTSCSGESTGVRFVHFTGQAQKWPIGLLLALFPRQSLVKCHHCQQHTPTSCWVQDS